MILKKWFKKNDFKEMIKKNNSNLKKKFHFTNRSISN